MKLTHLSTQIRTRIFTPNFPFSPRSFPIFYGWVIMFASMIGIIMSIPGQTMGVGVFTDDIILATGLSRFELSLAYMFGTIGSSFLLPYAGKLFDLWGARIMVVFASTGLGGSLLLLGYEPLIIQQFLLSKETVEQTLPHFITMMIIFLLLRQFGQGILTIVSRNMIGKWFDRKRGLVVGISGVVVSFGFSGSPLFLDWMIVQSNWQQTAFILAGIVGIGMSLFGWMFFRDNPEECGLQMDGGPPSPSDSQSSKIPKGWAKEFMVQEVRKTYTFWVYNLGLSLFSLIITAFTFHVSSFAELSGLSRTEAYSN